MARHCVCEPVQNVAYLRPPPGLQDTALGTLKTWSKPEPEITGCPEVTGHPWLQWDHWDTGLRTLNLDGNSTQQLPGHCSLLTMHLSPALKEENSRLRKLHIQRECCCEKGMLLLLQSSLQKSGREKFMQQIAKGVIKHTVIILS